jgi:hypothetical protein
VNELAATLSRQHDAREKMLAEVRANVGGVG